jgi:hypothetical protein
MGTRVLEFSRAHPDESPGYVAAVTGLEERLARVDRLATQQREGTLEVRAATARKLELKRTMRRAHLSHLARVAKVAARDVPELAQKLVMKPGFSTYQAFRTAARGMAAEAQGRKEVLVKHGLVQSVLDSLVQSLDQLDAAFEQGSAGRQSHVAASAELRELADEIVQIVRVMDGLNRYRFLNDAALLAAWESASNVVAAPRSDVTPPVGGEVKPAA